MHAAHLLLKVPLDCPGVVTEDCKIEDGRLYAEQLHPRRSVFRWTSKSFRLKFQRIQVLHTENFDKTRRACNTPVYLTVYDYGTEPNFVKRRPLKIYWSVLVTIIPLVPVWRQIELTYTGATLVAGPGSADWSNASGRTGVNRKSWERERGALGVRLVSIFALNLRRKVSYRCLNIVGGRTSRKMRRALDRCRHRNDVGAIDHLGNVLAE